MSTYRLFPSTNGPATPSAYSGAYEAGVMFDVTQGGMWFQGYWWWVCNSGQQTSPVKFGLWEVTSATTGTLVPNSVVTSGTLTAGAWNYVPLPTPLPLSIKTTYMAVVGYTSTTGFPETDNQFGAGQPLAAGIANGPLFAFGSTNPVPGVYPGQTVFGTSSADPAVTMPASTFNNANFWMDLQVTDAAPVGTSYRLWPNLPFPLSQNLDTASNFTLGTEFSLSVQCSLNKIWFYSPPTVTQLPTRCAIWSVAGQSIVAGTDNASPTWSGAAGSGWVSCSYNGVSLPAGKYKTTVFNGAASPAIWNISYNSYWAAAGPGTSGIVTGPLSAPNNANADTPGGQSSYQLSATFAYPATNAGPFTYWVDVEVTPPVVPIPNAAFGTLAPLAYYGTLTTAAED